MSLVQLLIQDSMPDSICQRSKIPGKWPHPDEHFHLSIRVRVYGRMEVRRGNRLEMSLRVLVVSYSLPILDEDGNHQVACSKEEIKI